MTLDQAKRYILPRGFSHAGRTLGDVMTNDWEYFSQLLVMPNTFGPLKAALETIATELGLAKKPEDPNQSTLNL